MSRKEEVKEEKPTRKSLRRVTTKGRFYSPEVLSEKTGYPVEEIAEQVHKSGAFDIHYSGTAVTYLRK